MSNVLKDLASILSVIVGSFKGDNGDGDYKTIVTAVLVFWLHMRAW